MTYNRNVEPHPTTIADVRDLAAIPVFSATGPNLAALISASKFGAYKQVQAGYWPSIKRGSKIFILVQPLLRQLGVVPDSEMRAS